MKAKKSYGQHFLKEESITKKIADSLQLKKLYKNVLEVGPGQGMLTKYLLEFPNHLLKVSEADKDMIAYLQAHYPKLSPNILAGDFLKLDLGEAFNGESFGLIGNYPYNISSQIIIKMIDNKELIPEMVGMFQKEVAQRIVAGPGSKTYGVISVFCQAFYDAEYLFSVKPGSFNPPPKVQSGVIRLVRKEKFADFPCDEKRFRTVVKVCFGQRRKMIRNTMKQFLKKNAILESDFFTQRPENLGVEDFIYLTNLITKETN